MQYFPLFVDTQSLKVVIVGAGDVASRKLDLLCRTEAVITVVAPEVSDEVLAYAKQGRIALEQRQLKLRILKALVCYTWQRQMNNLINTMPRLRAVKACG